MALITLDGVDIANLVEFDARAIDYPAQVSHNRALTEFMGQSFNAKYANVVTPLTVSHSAPEINNAHILGPQLLIDGVQQPCAKAGWRPRGTLLYSTYTSGSYSIGNYNGQLYINGVAVGSRKSNKIQVISVFLCGSGGGGSGGGTTSSQGGTGGNGGGFASGMFYIKSADSASTEVGSFYIGSSGRGGSKRTSGVGGEPSSITMLDEAGNSVYMKAENGYGGVYGSGASSANAYIFPNTRTDITAGNFFKPFNGGYTPTSNGQKSSGNSSPTYTATIPLNDGTQVISFGGYSGGAKNGDNSGGGAGYKGNGGGVSDKNGLSGDITAGGGGGSWVIFSGTSGGSGGNGYIEIYY